MNRLGLPALGLIWAGSLTPGFAAPTAAEPFLTGGSDYSTASPLIGQGPAATGFTGNWFEGYSGAGSPNVIAGGLSYSDGTNNMATTGGAVEYPLGGNGRAGRALSSGYNDSTTGSVYFAVLLQPDTTGTGYRGFEMHNGSVDDGDRKLQIVIGEPGVGASDSNFVVRLFNNSNDGFAGDLGAGDTNVNLFVGKITFSTDNDGDSIQLWRNPSDLSSESASGTPSYSKSGFNLQFDRVAFARFNDNDGFKADELRFGTSWSDVTTVSPDYSGWASANVGGQASNLDFDGDGIDNGAEYFMGTAGNAFTPNPQVVAGAVTWPRAAGTVISSFKVEVSNDLVNWQDASTAYPANLNITGSQVSFTLPTGAGKIFTRLSVTP